jgi:hypothetical protein
MAQSTENLWAAMRAPFWKRFGIGKTLPANLDYAFDNNFALRWRNAADTANFDLIKVNASNEVEFGGGAPIGTDVTLKNGAGIRSVLAGGGGFVDMIEVNASDEVVLPSGATSSDDVTLANTKLLKSVNAAGNGTVDMISVDATDTVKLPSGASSDENLVLANTKAIVFVNAAGNGSVSALTVGASDIPTLLNGARVQAGAQFNASVLTRRTTIATVNTAGPETYTAAQLLGGFIARDTAGAPRDDVLPAAADLVAAITGAVAGDSFEFIYANNSGAADASTLTAPDAAVTIVGTAAIAQNDIKRITVVVTNVGAGTEAYSVYIPS